MPGITDTIPNDTATGMANARKTKKSNMVMIADISILYEFRPNYDILCYAYSYAIAETNVQVSSHNINWNKLMAPIE